VTKKDFEGLGKKIVRWVLEDRQTWVEGQVPPKAPVSAAVIAGLKEDFIPLKGWAAHSDATNGKCISGGTDSDKRSSVRVPKGASMTLWLPDNWSAK
jgi:hypothetical protein